MSLNKTINKKGASLVEGILKKIQDSIYVYNMRYRGSVEDRVHELLSDRLEDIFSLFGQIPDILEDVWIDIANGEIEKAKKNIFEVPITDKGSITHYLRAKFKASRVLLRPAPEGHGIIAGGPVRVVLELAGFSNITAKMLGSRNKINSLKATIKAFQNLRK